MSKLINLTLLALVSMAVVASSADATTGSAMLRSRLPIGVGSNTAAVAGSTGANLAAAAFIPGAGAVVSCVDDGLHITTPLPTDTIHATPTFSGCVYTISGTNVSAVTVDHNCEWTVTLHHSLFDTGSGVTSGSTLDICELTLTAPAIGCTLHMTAINGKSGVTLQNITSTGAADTSASPWGSKITTTMTGLHFASTVHPGGNCIIPSTTSAGIYSSSVYVRNVWASL